MDLGEGVKEALKGTAGFARLFVNILGAPRSYGSSGRLFDATRFNEALLFLGMSLVVTMTLKAPMFQKQPAALTYLAADGIWKFAVVLLEAVVIANVWRILRRRGRAGNYLVANCFYFGVLSVVGHAALLVLYGAGLSIPLQVDRPEGVWQDLIYHLQKFFVGGIAIAIAVWTFQSWRAYGDFNKASLGRTIAALALVIVATIPVLWIGGILRSQLLQSLTGK